MSMDIGNKIITRVMDFFYHLAVTGAGVAVITAGTDSVSSPIPDPLLSFIGMCIFAYAVLAYAVTWTYKPADDQS